MIKVTELSCCMNGKRVLDRINLNIEPGSFVAVMGHNGSGKSTLVRHLNALITPDEGSVFVDGMDTADTKNIYEIRQSVVMVFQNPESQSVASIVEDDIAFGPENLGLDGNEIQKRIETALSACGIEHLRSRDISTLSGGQKQLAAIAGIIAMQPQYMIFDEATSMLDPQSGKLVLDCVMKLKNELNTAVIWITHNTDEAALADRVVVLENGKITADGSPDVILSGIERTEEPTDISGHATPLPTEKAALTLKNVSFSYPTPTVRISALKNISVTVPAGRITAVIGKTGSGKSTLAEIMSGITKPDSGSVACIGSIGIVLQTPTFFEDTVYDEIAYAPKQLGIKGDRLNKRVTETALRLGLTDEILSSSPFNLSGGEQKLVSLAAIIASDPDILILDEPTAGLDAERKRHVLSLMQSLKECGKTVIFITHSMTDAANTADNIIAVNDGMINGGNSHAS